MLGLTLVAGYCGTMLVLGLLSGWRGKTIHTRQNVRTAELHRVRRTARAVAAHN
jgi:hypothetical protein